MNNMNIDENTMQNIKNMVDNGNISEAISNISPEMIQNFSKMLSNQQNNQTQNNNSQTAQTQNSTINNQNFNTENNNFNNNNGNGNSNNNNMNFDLNNIDMNTIMKMSSILGKVNNPKDDPRANLLNSLKPYLRDSKKGQLDNYMSLLNVAKIADIMKDNNKENKNNV